MTELLSQLHIGTSGWSYKHWCDIFYPKEIRAEKYLEFYADTFSCVELNSSFYHLPLKTTVTGWMNRTPETFRFCPKMSRFITHQMRLRKPQEPLQKFFDVFTGMIPRLGPILIQLPPGLSHDGLLAGDFCGILTEQYGQYQFAIEIRNKSWIDDSFFNLLSRHGIAFVIADSGKRYPYYEAVTANFVYLRFHGREHLYATNYDEAVLQSFAVKIMNWLGEGKAVWAFFNNDFHGFAVDNAMRLRTVCESNL